MHFIKAAWTAAFRSSLAGLAKGIALASLGVNTYVNRRYSMPLAVS